MKINNRYEITPINDGKFEVNNLRTSTTWRGVFNTFEAAWGFVIQRLCTGGAA